MKRTSIWGVVVGIALATCDADAEHQPWAAPMTGSGTNSTLTTNRSPALVWQALTNLIKRTNSPLSSTPAPGIYKTEPHTCLVLVPEGDRDAKMLIPSEKSWEKFGALPPRQPGGMPEYKPELRLVPRAVGPSGLVTPEKKIGAR